MRFRDNGPYAVFNLNLYFENTAKIVDNSEFARQDLCLANSYYLCKSPSELLSKVGDAGFRRRVRLAFLHL
jgi:hypothetical protein